VVRIAELLARMGHPEPMRRLTGGDNPIPRWQRAHAHASRLNDTGEREEAARLLRSVLDEMEGATGTAITELRPKVHGLLGTVRFHQGDLAAARHHTAIALAECRAAGDLDGVRTYTENLALLDAVPDDGPAAGRRERVARAQDLSDATRYRASIDLLHEVLAELDAGDPLRAKACGLLGLNLYRLGDLPGARRWTAEALEACRRHGDEHGITIYTENLAVIDRRAR
jgi:hypothetical protein